MSNLQEKITGLTRERAIQLIQTDPNLLDRKLICHLISTMKGARSYMKPKTPKVGDIFMHKELLHPALLIKIKKGVCYCLLITSEEKCVGIIHNVNTRLFDGYVTSTLVVCYPNKVMENIISVYENKKELTLIRNKAKLIYNNV